MLSLGKGGIWQVGDWLVDASDDTISRGGETTKLEPRMMRLLLCLLETPAEVVPLDKLLAQVWPGVIVGPASVYQAVSQLRRMLGDTGEQPTYIATVARKGYRLIAPVSAVERSALRARLEPAPAAVPSAAPPLAAPPPAPKPAARWKVWSGVAAGLAALVAIAWAPVKSYLTEPSSKPPTIVVLPFADMTTDKSNQAFCDGLTEELSNWLAPLPTLKVIARTSAFAFRDKSVDATTIAKELGVTHLLEGSVRRSGDQYRITVQLIDGRDGYHMWSGSYDSPAGDLVVLQEKIARAVAANLEIRLAESTTQRMFARRTNSARAYQYYLLARYHRWRLTREDNERAIALYKQAIAVDKDFALAYAGLASAYLRQPYLAEVSISDIAKEVEPLLTTAEMLNPNLPEIYVARANLETALRKTEDASRNLQRAIALNPSALAAYGELGRLYLSLGMPREAAQNYVHASTLDPLVSTLHANLCLAYQDMAQFDRASTECAAARAAEPQAPYPYTVTSWLMSAQGRLDEALHWNAEAIKRNTDVADLYLERGDWLLMLGIEKDARTAYEKALKAAAGRETGDSGLMEFGFMTALATGGPQGLRQQIATVTAAGNSSAYTLMRLAYGQLLLGDSPSARTLVDRALAASELSNEQLNNAWWARVGYSFQMIIATAQMETGDRLLAEEHLKTLEALLLRMEANGVQRAGVHELEAQMRALRNQPEAAIRALNKAADLGWRDTWRATHERYFLNLRGHQDFQALLNSVDALNAKMRRAVSADASTLASRF